MESNLNELHIFYCGNACKIITANHWNLNLKKLYLYYVLCMNGDISMDINRHIYLVGFMGCGKSTVARELSRQLGIAHIDTDACIAGEQDMSIADIFEKYGEEHFRRLETDLLERLQNEPPAVIACGGGMAARDNNIELMKKSGLVVMLTARPDTIYARVRHNKNRPLLNGNMNIEYITGLMEKRLDCYNRAADVHVATDECTPEDIVKKIVELFDEM